MNEYGHTAILFEGERLPEEVMGVSIIECVTKGLPESVADWLWRLPICVGIKKSCPSHLVIKNCSFASDFVLDHKDEVVRGISTRFPKYEAEAVFGKWLQAMDTMRLIAEIRDECHWIAEGTELSPAEARRHVEETLKCIDTEARRVAIPERKPEQSSGDSQPAAGLEPPQK